MSQIGYEGEGEMLLPLVGAMRTPGHPPGRHPVLVVTPRVGDECMPPRCYEGVGVILSPLVGALRTPGHLPGRHPVLVVTPRRGDEDTVPGTHPAARPCCYPS